MEIKEAIEILACISYEDSQSRIAAQTVCLEVTRLQEENRRLKIVISAANDLLVAAEERDGNYKTEIARLRNDYLALDYDFKKRLKEERRR